MPDKDALTYSNPRNSIDDVGKTFNVYHIDSKSPRKGKKVFREDVLVFLSWFQEEDKRSMMLSIRIKRL